jgi:hypothetical protein
MYADIGLSDHHDGPRQPATGCDRIQGATAGVRSVVAVMKITKGFSARYSLMYT